MRPPNYHRPSKPNAYGSARDLPSIREMEQFLAAAKLLTLFIARDQRAKIEEIEAQIDRLCQIVDRFYEVLGPRNWIFHDLLNLEAVVEMLDTSASAEEAEARFVQIYLDTKRLQLWTKRLSSLPDLRARSHLIERALACQTSGYFDACALVLTTVMDGFVNDFQPDRRKGLAARDPDEMVAWDSIVGHHLGLTHALGTFLKTMRKRIDDEVSDLHRHGMIHGSVVRYDNPVVAAKAWNMLFALWDWAVATNKAAKPKPPEPTWAELVQKLQSNQEMKEQLDRWRPSTLSFKDPGFESTDGYTRTVEFMTCWRKRNFGGLAAFEHRLLSKGQRQNQVAGEMRERFTGFELAVFEVTQVENTAPAIWVTRGTATVNQQEGTFECRWVYQDESGHSAFGGEPGEWRLVFCNPSVWTPGSGGQPPSHRESPADD